MTPNCLWITNIERARKALRADRQGSFGDNVWVETVPLVPIRWSLHDTNGS